MDAKRTIIISSNKFGLVGEISYEGGKLTDDVIDKVITALRIILSGIKSEESAEHNKAN